jgi:hypothetical protein
MKKQEMNQSDGRKNNGVERIKFPVIEGIRATAAHIGVPVSLVKEKKRNGSMAFLTGNRVDTGILIPELFAESFENKEESLDLASEQARLTKIRADSEEIELELKRGRIHDVNEVERRVWQELLSPLRDGLWGCKRNTRG